MLTVLGGVSVMVICVSGGPKSVNVPVQKTVHMEVFPEELSSTKQLDYKLHTV